MLRYFYLMSCRLALISVGFVVCLAALSGCGDESGTTGGFAAAESQATGIEVTGNVAGGGESDSILVFAFLRSGDDAGDEPVSLGIVDEQGEFILSGLPAGKIGITFLTDAANDGAIDRGDPIAHLDDPDQQLDDLHDGDRARVVDVHLDFGTKRATADAIEVVRADEPAVPDSTPTPEQ